MMGQLYQIAPMVGALLVTDALFTMMHSFKKKASFNMSLFFFFLVLIVMLELLSKKYKAKMLGFYIFIVSELFMFFAAFWNMFHTWGEGLKISPTLISSLPLWGSLFLGVSSYTSTKYLSSKNFKELFFTVVLGSSFLILSMIEFASPLTSREKGVVLKSYYFLIMLHCSHVVVGLILLVMTSLFMETPNTVVNKFTMAAVIYWHFVDVMWIFVLFGSYRYILA